MRLGILDILLIGVGLSMDAFAVAVCKGLSMRKINWGQASVIALFFGGFQALMPFLGWLIGLSLQNLIAAYDHWIAFGLLAFIGGKFLYDSVREKDCDACDVALDIKSLFLLAVATSIDALAVGVTLAFLRVNVGGACALIGATTFIISLIGVVVGNFFGAKYQKKAEIAGGVILILIGVKILIEHLMNS